MEHLTPFELILVGMCIVIFAQGINAFMKDVFFNSLKTKNK